MFIGIMTRFFTNNMEREGSEVNRLQQNGKVEITDLSLAKFNVK
jgi:hypothetical protein